jgi:hypothetical protein
VSAVHRGSTIARKLMNTTETSNGACSTQQCELLLKVIIDSVERDAEIKILCLMVSRIMQCSNQLLD